MAILQQNVKAATEEHAGIDNMLENTTGNLTAIDDAGLKQTVERLATTEEQLKNDSAVNEYRFARLKQIDHEGHYELLFETMKNFTEIAHSRLKQIGDRLATFERQMNKTLSGLLDPPLENMDFSSGDTNFDRGDTE